MSVAVEAPAKYDMNLGSGRKLKRSSRHVDKAARSGLSQCSAPGDLSVKKPYRIGPLSLSPKLWLWSGRDLDISTGNLVTR